MRTNEIKNEIDEIEKWEEKKDEKTLYIKQININMIFNNMKQQCFWGITVKVFIMLKLV